MDRRTAIYRFCNYQERSHQEVKDKLYQLGSYPDEVNQLLAELIESGLLNEERFAKAFVRGKFRMKKWGRIKIIHELKPHHISAIILQRALREIDPSEYFNTASKLAEAKWTALKTERNPYARKAKVYRFLQQKGYEPGVINEVIEAVAAME